MIAEHPEAVVFYRLGHFIVARSRRILVISLLGLIIAAGLGVGAFGRLLSEGFDDPSAGATKAATLLDQKFGGAPNIIFLVHARSGSVDSPAVTADGQRLTKALEADQRLSEISSYFTAKPASLRSKDGKDALIVAQVSDSGRRHQGLRTRRHCRCDAAYRR